MSESVLPQLAVFALTQAAMLAMVAIGVTIMFGTVRAINLAFGDVFSLSTVFITVFIRFIGLEPDAPWPTLLAGLALSLAAGVAFAVGLNVAIERLAFRPFRGRSRLAPLIATMGISFILWQVALLWRKFEPTFRRFDHRSVPGQTEAPRSPIPELVPQINLGPWFGAQLTFELKDAMVIAAALLCVGGAAWFVWRTRTGRAIRAVAQDPALAQMVGVSYDGAVTRAFAAAGVFAGIAAFVFSLYEAQPYGQHGIQSGLTAFTAAVIGGIGNPIGAALGSALIGALSVGSEFYLGVEWKPVLINAALIAVLLLRGAGDLDGAYASAARETLLGEPGAPRRRGAVFAAVVAIGLAMAYPIADNALRLSFFPTLIAVMIFAVLALGLNVLLGRAGMLDLGFAVMFGIGAYTAALLTDRYSFLQRAFGLSPPFDFAIVLVVSAVVAAGLGALNGWLTLRTQGDYLAIVTLAFGLIVQQLIRIATDVTNGIGGIAALPAPIIAGQALARPDARYYLALAVLAAVFFLMRRLASSRPGRAFMAIGDDVVAARSSGVDDVHYKLSAFVICGAVAGVGGALYAGAFNVAYPGLTDFDVSAMVLAMVIVGGAGDEVGVLMGAIFLGLLDRVALPALGNWLGDLFPSPDSHLDLRVLSFFAFGLVLYLTVLLRARAGRRA